MRAFKFCAFSATSFSQIQRRNPATSHNAHVNKLGSEALLSSRWSTTGLFNTHVNFKVSSWQLGYTSPTIFIGSCFSENISCELKRTKFPLVSNPNGIMFNPISISQCLNNCINLIHLDDSALFVDQINPDIVHSWQHHSSFSRLKSERRSMLQDINNNIQAANEALKAATAVFITLGTSFIHELVATGEVVSNCHKQPSSLFNKRLLTVNEIVNSLLTTFEAARNLNPSIQVVMTVSPVRHTREGVVENSRSKAQLLCAVHELVDQLPSYVSYFPAYEFLVDELRDYRWYADDMIHPSPASVKLILSEFEKCYISFESISIKEDISSIRNSIEHRPLVPKSNAYQDHLTSTLRRVELAQLKYKSQNIDFSAELEILKKRLTEFE